MDSCPRTLQHGREALKDLADLIGAPPKNYCLKPGSLCPTKASPKLVFAALNASERAYKGSYFTINQPLLPVALGL